MKKIQILVGALFTVFLGTSAVAYDFSEADTLFAQREDSSTIAKTRALYEKALSSSASREDLLHAVERLGKLAFYEGELLTSQDDSSKRKQIFSKCLDYVENVNPSKIGKTGIYFYWKTSCLALWGRAAGMLSAAGRLSELKDNMKQGLEFDMDYAGGGIHRVVATIHLRASWLSGLQDYEKALVQINEAVKKGPEYFNVYLVKAEVLRALNRNNEALVVLENAKRELEKLVRANKLPLNLEPESKVFLKQIKFALNS
jgi:tetratricopeptide (TPR) repeat protein